MKRDAFSVSRERMSRVDTAWLRMDNDVNLMMIVGVWLLRPALAYEALCERVETRLLQYARFRQKVVVDATGADWVPDEAFDLREHVVRERLVRGRRESERIALQRHVGELAATPLDPDHALWQFHLVEGYDGGSALIARIHHCIGDGIALTAVMLSIADGGSDPPRRRHRSGSSGDVEGGVGGATMGPLAQLSAKALALYDASLARTLGLLSHPQHGIAGALDGVRAARRVLTDVAALALMPDDSPTRLKGKPSGRKRVAWSEPVPLERVKWIGKGLGCSINDVLLACVAGALGSYLRAAGDDPCGQEIRAMVPINLRPMEEAWQLGNRFGLAPLVLPIGVDNPVERVYAVHARMTELKSSYQPLLAFVVLAVAGLTVKPVQDAILGLFAKKATAVMTNVPGPPEALALCGSTLRQTMFWVPASGDIGIGVSILSYAGGVQFGLVTDAALCPDPQAVIDRFEPEFEKLLWLTLMLPWRDGTAR